MAKQQLRDYVFTPGAAGIGNIKVPGKYTLDQIILITNVTRNTILYNFADALFNGTTVTFTEGNDATNFPKIVQREAGFTTITLTASTVGQSSSDRLSVLMEEREIFFRPYRFGTDAIERMRISQGQSMIDADFEYGLQPTKWAGYGIVRGYPSVYEIPGVDLTVNTITTDGGSPNSQITITTSGAHGISDGQAISITGLNDGISGFSQADGLFIVSIPNSTTIQYYAWGVVGVNNDDLKSDAIQLKRGGIYSGAGLSVSSGSSTGSNPSVITINFNSNHGLMPGAPIYVISNRSNATGPFYVETVPSLTSVTFTARTGAIASITLTAVYCIAGSQIIHRPFDGGVYISVGIPAHGASVIRVSKKYFRYQSGKGLLWSTGTLFKPNYDIRSISSSGTIAGSTITVTLDGVAHGCQIGALIAIEGVSSSGYNGNYLVASIVSDISFTITANTALGSAAPVLGMGAKVVLEGWHGSVVRAGCFDDQNGMFWEYDGMNLCVVRRNSTQQLTGTITISNNSNQITGSNTRFLTQVRAGDKIVIRGMTHWVTTVASNTSMFVNPDFRGVSSAVQVKASLVVETRVKQSEFNIDRVDGTGPTGFRITMARMHMLGIQYTWYGAGFIDFMVRGADGNWVYVHRLKNNNVNYEAHMRSGNLPVRYSIENEGGISYLTSSTNSSQTSIYINDTTFFATTGSVYIDNEIINYTGKTTTGILTGCTRAATLTQYINGANRNFTAGAAAAHTVDTGVIQLSSYGTPTLSHWGSALLCDGMFDEDRGYLFNYQRTDFTITRSTQTSFLIRLAPSISNSTIGDLGVRDLLNRSQLLLNACTVSLANGAGNPTSVVVEGILNPKNFSNATWQALNLESVGGQPSFAQVATSVTYSSGSFALPGEQVFAFAAQPSGDATLDLNQLKELTNSPLGGSGAFPNGPDILAVNVRVSGGQVSTATVIGAVLIRWSEAQA